MRTPKGALPKGTRVSLNDLDGFMECEEQGLFVGSIGTVVGWRVPEPGEVADLLNEVKFDKDTSVHAGLGWGITTPSLSILL